MRVEVEENIVTLLKNQGPLSFGDLKARSDYKGQDLRKGIDYLIHNDTRIYVDGVKDKQKFYAYRE